MRNINIRRTILVYLFRYTIWGSLVVTATFVGYIRIFKYFMCCVQEFCNCKMQNWGLNKIFELILWSETNTYVGCKWYIQRRLTKAILANSTGHTIERQARKKIFFDFFYLIGTHKRSYYTNVFACTSFAIKLWHIIMVYIFDNYGI